MIKGWRECKLGDVAEINPSESLKKGILAKKIPMDALQPFTKKISQYTIEPYNGGVKFRNGDILVARITPSLENGKTSFVNILDEDEVGFGSTEFIVLREKTTQSDKHFLYYFAISSEFREVAINSMNGSSGRQRVQNEVVFKHKFSLPPLEEQKAIAEILSSLDDKIDLLHRQNQTLESIAQTLFRQWFIQDAKPEWEVGKLGDYVDVVDNRGKTPPFSNDITEYPIIEVNALSGESRLVNYSMIKKYTTEYTYNSWFRTGHPKLYDTLLSTVGSIGEIAMFLLEKGSIAQNIIALRAKNISPFYLYENIKFIQNELKELDIGSVQPSIKVTHLLKIDFIRPNDAILKKFDAQMIDISNKIILNSKQIQTLENLRDTLLPKLISGEVRIKI